MRTDRVIAFSDGVFAILITILVLELKVPVYRIGNINNAIFDYWPTFLAYIITYFYIGILWLFHHDLFQVIKKTNISLNILNLVLIFFITLLSFSMSLLSITIKNFNINDLKTACYIYTTIAFFISFIFFVIYKYLFNNEFLLTSNFDHTILKSKMKYPLFSLCIYLMAFILTSVNVYMGLVFLIVGIFNHLFAYIKISAL